MRKAIFGTGAALVLAAAGQAGAEGWTVTDFNSVSDRATCMSYAETTVNVFRQRFNSPGFTGRSDWTLGAYDLRGDVVDALFICADESGLVAPFLVVYNTDDDSPARETIADRLGDIWDEVVAGGGAVSSGGVVGGTK
ncbi:hypothetical protein N8I71_05885 [Roseibacterium sp. SDUM158016]|jgi:hypothetical protein|uniref:hypothetical protein n=1 Tax=Roseicyclus sediminis TaxID=2980997 RepID=UPI0021D2D700|nr:hypothetical protein [Roseibacterium sp. SDUM158016]MCU4652351.1 hypothetical protein [Roseibacterium sp. SDUM158016]